jgi:hypothetical protein
MQAQKQPVATSSSKLPLSAWWLFSFPQGSQTHFPENRIFFLNASTQPNKKKSPQASARKWQRTPLKIPRRDETTTQQ